jgi:hypothetical protein
MHYWKQLTLKETAYGLVAYNTSNSISYEVCDLSYRILQSLKEKNEEQQVLLSAEAFGLSRPEMTQKLHQLKQIFGTPAKRSGSRAVFKWVREEALFGIHYVADTKGSSGLFSVLFNPIVFAVLVVVSLAFMLAHFLTSTFLEVGTLSVSTLWILLLLALSTVWHEIGHIQAARTFGLSRISIGAGIYYFIPVLFTDMTATYLLDKPKRLLIGIAGIYFEWIYVLALLSCSLFFEEQLLSEAGFIVFLKSLYNLNPFFKTDGYWLLSDFLQIHQLRDRSYQTLLKVVIFKKSLSKTEVLLVVYALLHLSFYALFIFFLIRRLQPHFGDLMGIEIAELNWSTLKVGGVVALEILLIFHLARLLLQAFYSLPKYLATVTKK